MPGVPHVAGFDLPGDSQAPDEEGVLVALLSEAPSRSWQAALDDRAEAFGTRHGITQLRLIGDHLYLVGPVSRLRVSAAVVQDLVSETGQAVLARGVCGDGQDRPDPAADAEVARLPDRNADPRTREVAAVCAVPGIQQLLAEVCAITGMRFSAVARVTDRRWTTCAVADLLDFGLKPGQDLILETTICRELRPGRTTSFGQASTHPVFAAHPAPKIYGFESHISVPLVLADGTLFGSLCALDPRPAVLDEAVLSRVEALAASIAAQLAIDAPPG